MWLRVLTPLAVVTVDDGCIGSHGVCTAGDRRQIPGYETEDRAQVDQSPYLQGPFPIREPHVHLVIEIP